MAYYKLYCIGASGNSYKLAANIVARMERSEIRDSRDAGPGFRFAPSGLQPLVHVV